MKNKIIILILLFAGSQIGAQTKTNFDEIIALINKSVSKIDSTSHSNKTASVIILCSPNLEVLKSKILESFSSLGYKLKSEPAAGELKISYTIMSCGVEYSDIKKDGLFGSTIVNRKVWIKCSALISGVNGTITPIDLNESATDEINVDELKTVEDPLLQFTQAQIPQLPFLSNLVEPIVVVGALVSTVILLFTIRSK